MRLNKRIKAIYGGSSSGKTYNILAKLYNDAVNNPGEKIHIASNTLANLKEGAMTDFKNILLGLDRWDPSCWKKSDSSYELKNGSVIKFIGLDDETKARGPRRERLFIDEANRVDFDVYQQLELRTSKEVLLSWNPSGPFWYNEYVRHKVDHDELVVNFNDNEALNKIELKKFSDMKKASTTSDYNMNRWKVFGLGEWGQTRGACVRDYKVVDEIPDLYQLVGIGLDFGDNDPNAAVALYKKEDSYVFDEILYKPKMDLQDIYLSLRGYDAEVYADYSGAQIIRYLDNKGLNITKCRKGPDSIKLGINLLNEKDIYVTKRSKNLLNEFLTYRYKEDKDGHLIDNKYEGPDHLVDACRYVLKEQTRPTFFVV